MNILVADDTKTERFFINRLFLRLGIKADIASGGKEAIRLSSEKKYDAIFLDTAMPEPDGAKTYRIIHENKENPNSDTPVIYMGTMMQDFPTDDTYHIKKPVIFSELSDIIKEILPTASAIGGSTSENAAIPAWLNDIPDLDTAEGIAHCGSQDGYLAALDIFYSTIDTKAGEIEDYYENEDYEAYTIKVHALKSSARIIGANALADLAYELEMAGKEGNIDLIKSDTEPLMKAYRAFLSYLSPLSNGSDDSTSSEDADNEKEPIPDDVLKDAYSSIRDFSEAMDFDLTEMVIKSLDEYKLSDKDTKKVAQIHKKLLNLDWDGIKEELD